MPTNEMREMIWYLPVDSQTLPKESKYALNEKKDEAKLHRLETKEIRLLDNPIVEYKKPLIDVLDVRSGVLHDFQTGDMKEISQDAALHTPYRRMSA